MKYFYDGCDPNELDEILEKGCISGVTTNVNFVIDYAKKEQISSYFKAVEPIYNIAVSSNLNIPFSIQALGKTTEELISSALKIRDQFSEGVNLYIKIPVNYNNLYAIKFLSNKENINVNATCITSFLQASLAFNSGAKILSYFWGKMTDEGIDPRDHVHSLKKFIIANNSQSEILCGSIRQSRIIHEALMSEADILTLPFAYFSKISERKKSEEATDIFNNAWTNSNMTLI
tara:strand:- start:2338 stop:3033 length:696 start_codon:yes stop_codon:yes gene_type:complete